MVSEIPTSLKLEREKEGIRGTQVTPAKARQPCIRETAASPEKRDAFQGNCPQQAARKKKDVSSKAD